VWQHIKLTGTNRLTSSLSPTPCASFSVGWIRYHPLLSFSRGFFVFRFMYDECLFECII